MMQWTGIMYWGHLGALVAGDVDRARWHVSEAEGKWSPDGVFLVQDFWRLQAICRIALYDRDYEAALAALDSCWSGLRSSLLLALDLSRAIALDLRARANLGIAARSTGRTHSRAVDAVQRDIKRLRKIGIGLAGATARVLAAQLLWLRADGAAAQEQFARAEIELSELGYELLLTAVRVRVGELQGPAGDTLRRRSLGWLEKRGVADPDAFVRMLIPVGGEE